MALKGTAKDSVPDAVLRKQSGSWKLIVSHAGGNSFISFERPVVVSVGCRGGRAILDAMESVGSPWRIFSSYQGVACAPHRADGFSVVVNVLRPERAIEIDGIGMEGAGIDAAEVYGTIVCGDAVKQTEVVDGAQ
jgi:hypothetical protein